MNDIPPPETSTPQSRPPGRARQRIQQRRAGTTTSAPKEPRRSLPQLAPSGGLKLPALRVTTSQLLPFSIVGGLLFIILIVFVLGRVRNDAAELPPNALWVGTEWTYSNPDAEAMDAWVQELRAHQIGTVYAWLSWLQADNTWNGADQFENVRQFVGEFNRAYPEAELLAWIGFPTDAGSGNRLPLTEQQIQVAEFSQTAVTEFGFDGVFLNVEPVLNDDQDFLALLRRVRSVISSDAVLAAAIPPDWTPLGADVPQPAQIAPGTEWSLEYKQSVALLVDQMAIAAYNSGLTDPVDYSQWVAYQVSTYAQAIAALATDIPTRLMIGVPTYDAQPLHDPLVENVESGVMGLLLGIEQAGEAANYVQGAAVYWNSTTDEQEWGMFENLWLRR